MMRKRKGYPVYPLTVAQKFHTFYLQFCQKPQVLNIGTSLTIGADIDLSVLKQSIYKAYERCEAMRLRFAKDKEGTIYQYVVDKEERDIEFVDFSDKTMEEAETIMRGWTEVPFKLEDSPMNRIVMIRTSDGYTGLYMLVSHLTMDAQSLILFFKDIVELYCNALYEGVEYPKEMASYIEQLQKDLAYEAGSKAQARDAAFFEQLIDASEPIYNGITGKRELETARAETGNPNLRVARNVSDSVESALDIFHLEGEPTKRLMDFCEKYHLEYFKVPCKLEKDNYYLCAANKWCENREKKVFPNIIYRCLDNNGKTIVFNEKLELRFFIELDWRLYAGFYIYDIEKEESASSSIVNDIVKADYFSENFKMEEVNDTSWVKYIKYNDSCIDIENMNEEAMCLLDEDKFSVQIESFMKQIENILKFLK